VSTGRSGRVWAYLGIVVGAVVSVAANVAHSFVRPPDVPATGVWRPEVGAVLGAMFWPIALLITTEIMTRTGWPPGRAWLLLRFAGLLPVAGVAGIVSYLHLHGLLQHYHEVPLTCLIAPLSVDGLMVMASSALVAHSHPTTSSTSTPTATTSPPAAVVSASPPQDVPADADTTAADATDADVPIPAAVSATRAERGHPVAVPPAETDTAETQTGPDTDPEPVTGLGACEGCRTRPATTTWSRPRAGHPYRLCGLCAADLQDAPTGQQPQPQRGTPARPDATAASGSVRSSTASRVVALAVRRPDLSTADIARQVGVSTRTVRRHLADHRTTPPPAPTDH